MKTVHLMTTGSLGHKFSFPGQIELPSLTVKIHRPNDTEVSLGYNKLSTPLFGHSVRSLFLVVVDVVDTESWWKGI